MSPRRWLSNVLPVMAALLLLCVHGSRAECNSPCLNGGGCLFGSTCICPIDFEGKSCEKATTCTSPCENGGTCSWKNRCHCPEGFDGDRCEKDICKEPPRPRNAKMSCSKLTIDFISKTCTAECEEGYLFPNRKNKAEHFCFLRIKSWKPQYEFPDCEAACNPPCKNGGTCGEGDQCVCLPGFDGEKCENDICKAPPSPPNGNIICLNFTDDRIRKMCTAECEEGYLFPNGENEVLHVCDLRAKAWRPRYEFPDCEVSSCPAGMVYKFTSACPKTCENYKTYREDNCPVMPQNTCVCPDGEVMKLGKCVKTIACDVCDEEGHVVGDVWQVGLCKTCECLPNLYTICTVLECPEPPLCGERETLQKMTGRIATCCDSYKCVPKVWNCEVPKLEICPPGRSLVLKHSNNCPVYRCECLPQLCPPSVTPFLDDGESLRLVTTDCCPEVRLSCNPNSCDPPPNCTQGFRLSTQRARCCFKHKCVPEDNVCIYQHQYDVVDGIQVKLPLEKNYDKDYQPGSTWHDGLCRECTCVNIKGRMLSRCRLELCQHPADFPDSERYIREEVRVPGSCCPKYWRKLCVDQGVKYRIGQEWRSPSRHHLCNNISRCVSDNAGEAVIEVATECEKPCER